MRKKKLLYMKHTMMILLTFMMMFILCFTVSAESSNPGSTCEEQIEPDESETDDREAADRLFWPGRTA